MTWEFVRLKLVVLGWPLAILEVALKRGMMNR